MVIQALRLSKGFRSRRIVAVLCLLAVLSLPEPRHGLTSGRAKIQNQHAGDPIAAHAQFVAEQLPRSGWPHWRREIEDTPGSRAPGAEASYTDRSALAKHGPAELVPHDPLL